MKTVRMLRAAGAIALCAAMWMTTACVQASVNNQDQRNDDRVYSSSLLEELSTDKAAYLPGEDVQFHLKLKEPVSGETFLIRYLHMDTIVKEERLKAEGDTLSWNWNPPQDDGKGYLAEVFYEQEGMVADQMNIAVDVSSDWGKFPRYGYLADFPRMNFEEMSRVIGRLNRFHMNGIQFYDWQYKHQEPIRFENGKPAAEWNDIANRPVALDTVKAYIDLSTAAA